MIPNTDHIGLDFWIRGWMVSCCPLSLIQLSNNPPIHPSDERPPLRLAPVAQESRLHRRGHAHARTRHRGEHCVIQPHQRTASPSVASESPKGTVGHCLG